MNEDDGVTVENIQDLLIRDTSSTNSKIGEIAFMLHHL